MSAFLNYVSSSELLSKAAQTANALISAKHTDEYTYHNLEHTLRVTENAYHLGVAQNLSDEKLEDLLIAGFFHDTGYYDSASDHEAVGAAYVENFLQENEVPLERSIRISKMILSTKITTAPSTTLEEILCDADLNYLGASEFFSLVERLRLEWLLTGRKNFTEKAWIQQNIDFFEQHTYYTREAQQLFGHGKEKHLEQMRSDLRALTNPS